MSKIKLSSIVAAAENNAIGKNNDMIWHISEDLKHFKRTTLGKPIIMGRKSYESLGKPLPGRPNLVISRSYKNIEIGEPTSIFLDMEADGETTEQKVNEGPHLYASIEASIEAAKKMAKEMNLDEIFITGGGEIYKQTMPLIDRLYITIVHKEYEADTFFPEFDWNDWNITHEDRREADGDTPAFTFFTLDRKS